MNNNGSGAAAGAATFFANAAAWVAGAVTTVGGWFSSFFSLLAPAAAAPKPTLPSLPKGPQPSPTVPKSNPKTKLRTRNDPTKKKEKEGDVMEKAEINSVQGKNDTETGNNTISNRDMMEDSLYGLIPGMKSPIPAFTTNNRVPKVKKDPSSNQHGKELKHPTLSNYDESENSISKLLTKPSPTRKGKIILKTS